MLRRLQSGLRTIREAVFDGNSREVSDDGITQFDREESYVIVDASDVPTADDSVTSTEAGVVKQSALSPTHSSLPAQSEQAAAEKDIVRAKNPSVNDDSGHVVARPPSPASQSPPDIEEPQKNSSTREDSTAVPTTEQSGCQSRTEPETNESARAHETLHSQFETEFEEDLDGFISGGLTLDSPSQDLPPSITKHPTDERVTAGSDVRFSLEVDSPSPKMWSWEFSGSLEEKNIEGQVARDSLQKFYYQLIKEGSIDTIAPPLFSEKILSDTTMEKVRNPSIDSRAKMEQVLQDVLRRVRSHPHCFGYVCKTLEEGDIPCVEGIRAEYEKKIAESWKVLQDQESRLQGSSSSELTISLVHTHDSGRYRCKVSNRVGSRTSESAILTVEPRNTQVGGKGKVTPPAIKLTATDPPPAYGSGEKSCAYESMENTFDAHPSSPLHKACRELDWAAVRAYPMTTAATNSQDEHGDTPLHLAISSRVGRANDQLRIIQRLLENGAKPNTSNKNGDFPLHHACTNSSLEAVNCLLQHRTDPAVQNSEGKTPLHVACLVSHPGIAESLVTHDESTVDGRDQEGNTPLHLASRTGNPSTVRILLRPLKGCHHSIVFKRNTNMDTPLHLACERNNVDVVNILLELECSNGAVNAQNKEGNTALHISCRGGFTELVKCLMKHGADREHVNREAKVPLDLAPSDRKEAIEAALLGDSEAPAATATDISKKSKSKFPFPWKKK